MGLAIASKNSIELLGKRKPAADACRKPATRPMGIVPWAASVGLVPCPGVVMVMFYCLSMDQLAFGLLLAVFISLGMAFTISIVVISAILGRRVPEKSLSGVRFESIDKAIGVASGVIITLLGAFFLMTLSA